MRTSQTSLVQHQQPSTQTDSVSLHALTGHAVDDAVTIWIHEPDGI